MPLSDNDKRIMRQCSKDEASYTQLVTLFEQRLAEVEADCPVQNKLSLSQERFERAFYNHPTPMLLYNMETGERIEFNDRFVESTGYTREELANTTSRTLRLWVSEEDEQRAHAELRRNGYILDFPVKMQTQSGEIRHILLSSALLKDTDEPLTITMLVDVTERQRTALALQKAHARAHALLEALPDMVFHLNKDGQFIDAQADEREMLAESKEALLGKDLHDFFEPALVEKLQEMINEALASGMVQSIEYPLYVPKLKDTHDYEARILQSGENEVVAIVRDITERRKLFEAQMERERMQLLANFIQNAYHEFRTPLATINSSAYIMAHQPDESRRLAKQYQIEQQVKRITRLIDMQVQMVKLRTHDQIDKIEPVELTSLIKTIADQTHTRYKGIHQLRHHISDTPVQVLGYLAYLEDAFRQILDNAHRFTVAENGIITVQVQCNDTHAQVIIQDNGIGISDENIAHIFETFWRVDYAHSTPGFGLGLTIARHAIDLHRGDIAVESVLDIGTRVTVTLPLA